MVHSSSPLLARSTENPACLRPLVTNHAIVLSSAITRIRNALLLSCFSPRNARQGPHIIPLRTRIVNRRHRSPCRFLRKCSAVSVGEGTRRLEKASVRTRRGRLAMNRRSIMDEIRLPSHEEAIPAVTILDGQGRVVRVVPANEFRRGPIGRRQPIVIRGRGDRRGSGQPSVATETPTQSPLGSGHARTEPVLTR